MLPPTQARLPPSPPLPFLKKQSVAMFSSFSFYTSTEFFVCLIEMCACICQTTFSFCPSCSADCGVWSSTHNILNVFESFPLLSMHYILTHVIAKKVFCFVFFLMKKDLFSLEIIDDDNDHFTKCSEFVPSPSLSLFFMCVYVVTILIFFSQGMVSLAALDSLCRQGWPCTHLYPPAFASLCAGIKGV